MDDGLVGGCVWGREGDCCGGVLGGELLVCFAFFCLSLGCVWLLVHVQTPFKNTYATFFYIDIDRFEDAFFFLIYNKY